ncbi:unnamed protein product [Owenia fusiformis]|uniref:Leucine-rich repeat-containing protein 61 n=1 Tax=Owenia fusiformis TaxID=6347 RepID=A0A8S4PW67_OWEFU|nr:unnamed protein product [Owenia fusiformis]
MAAGDGRITKQMLKCRTGEFDLESIHTLDLKEMDIGDLGCLGECTGLERLDLSRNDVTRLYALASLTNLITLNLSANRICSLEGLQALDNLESLNLAGNLLGSVGDLRCLSSLEKLTDLRLRDTIHDIANPMCMSLTYKKDVPTILPTLQVLDGERLSGKGSELFKLCNEIDQTLEDGKPRDGPVKEYPKAQPWVPKDYWTKKSKKMDGFENSSIHDAEEQLKELLGSCRVLSEQAEESVYSSLMRNTTSLENT